MEDNNKGIYDKSDAKSSENYEDGVIVFDNDDVCDDISSYDVVVSDPNVGVDEKCDDAGVLCNNVLDTEGNSGNSAKSLEQQFLSLRSVLIMNAIVWIVCLME